MKFCRFLRFPWTHNRLMICFFIWQYLYTFSYSLLAYCQTVVFNHILSAEILFTDEGNHLYFECNNDIDMGWRFIFSSKILATYILCILIGIKSFVYWKSFYNEATPSSYSHRNMGKNLGYPGYVKPSEFSASVSRLVRHFDSICHEWSIKKPGLGKFI